MEFCHHNRTIGCKITAIEKDKLLSFEWKGPIQFASFMNDANPLTHVTITFIPQGDTTEVHLIHSGWRSNKEWEEARQWFEKVWQNAFVSLEERSG